VGGRVGDDPGGTPSIEAVEPFFAPRRDQQERSTPRARLGARRLLVRIFVCALALFSLDRFIAPSFAPPAAYMGAYRLPRTAPTTAIADYANAIDLAARVPGRVPIAIFLGASPTYGHRIKDTRNTFPYAYASAAASAGAPVTAFNLAANGQFVGDYYVIAKRLVADADIVFVQLTYHTFSPTAREDQRIRYRELPNVLGVPLTIAESRLLGLQPSSDAAIPAPPAALNGALSRWWTLYRQRDLIDQRIFGGSPRNAMADFVRGRTSSASQSAPTTTTTMPEDTANDGFTAFDALDPGMQMVVVAQYAEDSSFTIDPADGEVVILDRLASELATAHKKAVFFMSPMNRDVIDSYGLIDPEQYRSNIELLRETVARSGFSLIDHNADARALPAGDFTDISHTTDAGGARFGAVLLEDTLPYLRSARP